MKPAGPARPAAPSDEQYRRARAAAPSTAPPRDHLLFSVGGRTFALAVAEVREIVRPMPITEVPRAPAWIPGIVSVRGAIVAVVDVGARLGLTPAAPPGRRRLLLAAWRGETVGLLIDRVIAVGAAPTGGEPRPLRLDELLRP